MRDPGPAVDNDRFGSVAGSVQPGRVCDRLLGSMGGSTIWAYCDLFGTDRLRAVVTIDQTPKMINDDGWAFGFDGLTRDNIGTFFDHGIPGTGRGKKDRLSGFAKLISLLGDRYD